jgi:hypothetical protein
MLHRPNTLFQMLGHCTLRSASQAQRAQWTQQASKGEETRGGRSGAALGTRHIRPEAGARQGPT